MEFNVVRRAMTCGNALLNWAAGHCCFTLCCDLKFYTPSKWQAGAVIKQIFQIRHDTLRRVVDKKKGNNDKRKITVIYWFAGPASGEKGNQYSAECNHCM